ncbi:MAG: hypothetical protein HY760_06915 [Nitrospirae bacterium]|nr:hypothetical protein [Nitrospirota bacterium]
MKQEIAMGRLSLGHAKALLALPRKEDQIAAARRILSDGLSVRETEGLVKEGAGKKKKAEAPSSNANPQIRALETRLQRVFGTKVRIVGKGGQGKIVVEYYSAEDLQRILEVLEG